MDGMILMTARLAQLDGAAAMAPLDGLDPMARITALRLLRRLWQQYAIDRGLEVCDVLESSDASERSAFLAVLDRASWSALRWASAQVLAMLPPAFDPAAAGLARASARRRVQGVRDVIDAGSLEGPPNLRIAALIERLMAHDPGFAESEGEQRQLSAGPLTWTRYDPGPPSDTWAINLALALDGQALALGANNLPLPALVRREMSRTDRCSAWRQAALVGTITFSAETTLGDLIEARRVSLVCENALADRRSTSRAIDAAVLIGGLGPVTAARLARALGCTRPGAVRIIDDLTSAGLTMEINRSAHRQTSLYRRSRPPRPMAWWHASLHDPHSGTDHHQ